MGSMFLTSVCNSSTGQVLSPNAALFGSSVDGREFYTTVQSDILHLGDFSKRISFDVVTSAAGRFPYNGLLGVPSPHQHGK